MTLVTTKLEARKPASSMLMPCVSLKVLKKNIGNIDNTASKGWRQGTVHYRSSNLADKSQENKGAIHTDAGPNQCEDCHAYDSAAVHDSNGMIDFSDGTPFSLEYHGEADVVVGSDVWLGARVVVLPGREQATAVTTGVGSSRATAARDKPPGSPSSSDPPAKRFTPAEIAARLRHIDALVAQGQRLADATRQAGISAATYHRWRQEFAGQSNEPAKRPAEPSPEASKRIVEGEASAVRGPVPASKGHQESSGFEE